MVTFLNTLDMVGRIIVSDTGSVDGEIILLVADVLAVDGVEVALAEGKVMNRIQQVGLTNPVIPDKTIDLVGELVISLGIILKIR